MEKNILIIELDYIKIKALFPAILKEHSEETSWKSDFSRKSHKMDSISILINSLFASHLQFSLRARVLTWLNSVSLYWANCFIMLGQVPPSISDFMDSLKNHYVNNKTSIELQVALAEQTYLLLRAPSLYLW